MSVQILTVCSGNICRSPMAEQLLRAQLAGVEGITVSSAGTVGMVGSPMDERSARLAIQHGSQDADQHVARELSIEMIREADLVLAMAREHRKAIVEALPRAVRKTFTLREFARLASAIDGLELDAVVNAAGPEKSARLEAALEIVSSERATVRPADPEDDDIVDPYRRGDDVYLASADQLVPAVEAASAFMIRVARADPEP